MFCFVLRADAKIVVQNANIVVAKLKRFCYTISTKIGEAISVSSWFMGCTMSKPVKLSSLKKGEWFTICDHDGEEVSADVVMVRGDYDRSTRKYDCTHWDDIGRSRQYKGSVLVYIDFIF